LAELGLVIFRQESGNGGIKPHIFIRFKSKNGKSQTFAIDTTRTPSSKTQPDAYLITHAHSDHFGKSAMLSERAWCSKETAKALEIRYEKEYKGNTFEMGDTININDADIQTFDVGHTPGSTAFFWENEIGTKVLVTGDVKDPSQLPKCDVLITEASYGDPEDMSCYFKDDVESLHHAILSHLGEKKIAFGAYEFGKSQKAVSLIREMGYDGPIAMNSKTLSLTENFVYNAGKLVELGNHVSSTENFKSVSCSQTQIVKNEGSCVDAVKMQTYSSYAYSSAEMKATSKNDCSICIVPISELSSFGSDTKKYVLTCRLDYPFENIRLSDHLDVGGLTQMVKNISPKVTVVYHPDKDPRTDKFAKHLEKNGFKACSINQIQILACHKKHNGSAD